GMPNVHPLLVHFPIALLPVSVGLDLLGAVMKRRDAETAARWTLWLGAVGAALAVYTGHGAAEALQPRVSAEAQALLSTHHHLAIGVLAAAFALSLWRLFVPAPPRRWHAAYLVVAVGLVAALVIVSDLGGQLVFLHGVAVHQ